MAVHPAQVQTAPLNGNFLPLADTFVQGIRLVRVRGADIASVAHLREEIDLSVHAGPLFPWLEKKETSAASSSRSITWGSV